MPAAVPESVHTMDFLLPFALLGLLLLAALSFLLAGDRLFWFLVVPIVLIGGPALVLLTFADRNSSALLRSFVAVAAIVAIATLVIALAKRQYGWATLLIGPLVAGALMVLHGVMLITGGIPLLLLIGFMGGGIEYWRNSALVLFMLGALPVLVIAWKSARWARIVVSSLFGVLIVATVLAPFFGFVDRSGPGSILVYLAALAVAGLAAALGILFQYRRQREHSSASASGRTLA